MEAKGQATDQLGDELSERHRPDSESRASERELELTEEELQEQREFIFMSALLDSSSVLMLILDQQGRVRGFSQACEQTSGYTFEDVWGRHLWDPPLVPEQVELVKGVFHKLRDGQSPIEFESYWLTKDGNRRLIAWSTTALFDSLGSLEYVIAIGIDITERRRAEEARLAVEQIYETLVKITTDAVTATDLKLRITDVSQRTLELHGFTNAEELIGESAFQLIAPEDHENTIASLQETLSEEVVRGTGYTLMRKDGSRFIGGLDIALVRDGSGKPKAFLITSRGLGERELAEEAPAPGAEEYSQDSETPQAVLEHIESEHKARAILDSCKNVIGATTGYVVLLREDATQDEVLFSEPGGLTDGLNPARQMAMRQLHDEVYHTGKAIYLNDVAKSEWAEHTPEGDMRLDNLLFAPLVIGGEVVGLLSLANKRAGFTDNDARIASAFGELAVVPLYSDWTLEALKASEERFRYVSEISDHAIVTVDSNESIVFWNHGAEVIFGYSADEVLGKPFDLAASEDLRTAYQKAVNEVASAGGFTSVAEGVEMVGRRKDGSQFPMELSLATWKTRDGVFLTSVIRDITNRRWAEATVRHLTDHDPLTDLANRALFTDCLTHELANAERTGQKLAVIVLDLDRFVAINHALGQELGDQLLKSVASRLKDVVRAGDIVARLGGDEFMLLLPGIGEAENAAKIAQKILEGVRKPFLVDDHELYITAAIGIAVYPDDGDDVDTLLRDAELAMCRAKKQGGDSFQRSTPTTEVTGPLVI